jgi:hypothetical protein
LPFFDAQEAWFWFMRSQKAQFEGAKFKGAGNDMGRPCDLDDFSRAVMELVRVGKIGRHHLKVLAKFSIREQAPDGRLREESCACLLWDEALDRLSTILRKKGIIE